ncbi:MAG: hypothetical protein WC612_08440 [Bdellovibrionales bacterium]
MKQHHKLFKAFLAASLLVTGAAAHNTASAEEGKSFQNSYAGRLNTPEIATMIKLGDERGDPILVVIRKITKIPEQSYDQPDIEYTAAIVKDNKIIEQYNNVGVDRVRSSFDSLPLPDGTVKKVPAYGSYEIPNFNFFGTTCAASSFNTNLEDQPFLNLYGCDGKGLVKDKNGQFGVKVIYDTSADKPPTRPTGEAKKVWELVIKNH